MSHAHGNWNELVEQVLKIRGHSEESDRIVRNGLEEIDRKVLTATSYIGSPSKHIPALTLWDSIDAHTISLKDLAVDAVEQKKRAVMETEGMNKRVKVVETTMDRDLLPSLQIYHPRWKRKPRKRKAGWTRMLEMKLHDWHSRWRRCIGNLCCTSNSPMYMVLGQIWRWTHWKVSRKYRH